MHIKPEIKAQNVRLKTETTHRPQVSDVQWGVTKSKDLYMYTCVTVQIYEWCSLALSFFKRTFYHFLCCNNVFVNMY